MTPAETYTQKRVEAESLIRNHAPERLQSALIELLRPAIALSATRFVDEETPVGASKFGGAPDVPAEFVWPMWNEKPLGFLAQINLEEIAPFDVEEVLPKSGLLLFFHRWRNWFSDSEHRVELVPNEQLRPALVPMNFNRKDSWSIPLCRVSPIARWTLPDLSSREFLNVAIEEDWDEIDALLNAISNPTAHRCLGYASAVQDSVEVTAEMEATGMRYPQQKQQIEENASQWLPLLQIDSQLNPGYEPKWMFGDAGIIQWMIRGADIKARRWNETQFVFQCH